MPDKKQIVTLEMKETFDILIAYGFSETDAKTAVNNIKDKKNLKEAFEWLSENDKSINQYLF